MQFDQIADIAGTQHCYFEPVHESLKENLRIELILRMPGCQVLAIKFFKDKERVVMSLSNGMILLFNTITCLIEVVFTVRSGAIDCLKIIGDK